MLFVARMKHAPTLGGQRGRCVVIPVVAGGQCFKDDR